MESRTHYFWAIKLPPVTKQFIYDELEKVKEFFPFKRWVHQQDYHITLAFLGNAEQIMLDISIDLVNKSLIEEKAFSLTLNRLDVFGKMSSPRIFWAGVEQDTRLADIQSQCYKACKKAGIKLEGTPFNPHITLARNWGGELFERNVLGNHNPFQDNEKPFWVKEVVLYRTKFGATPKYEEVTNILLDIE